MAQFTIYTSADSGSPIVNSQSGSICRLLEACLVTGYGSKTAAGWTTAFSGSSVMAFRQASGSRFYWRIDDSNSGSGGQYEYRMRGYETMTTIDTGSSPFPSIEQRSTYGLTGRKSVSQWLSPTGSRTWVVAADDRTAYVFIVSGDQQQDRYWATAFGDFYSFLRNDAYNTMIIGRQIEADSQVSYENMDQMATSWAGTVSQGSYMARGHYGLGTSVQFNKSGNTIWAAGASANMFYGNLPFTNPSDGGIYMSRMWIGDPFTVPANGVRGRIRGLWQWQHPIAMVNDRDTFTGTGDLAGKTFLILKQTPNSGVYVIETSNTLETN